jgi:hypothetical protein
LTSSEKHSRDDGSRDRPSSSLPAIRHSAFAKHWLAVDDGGAELTKAVFGSPARRVPPRPVPNEPSMPRPAATSPQGVSAPSRLRATVALLLLALAVLFAEPAARLLGIAPRSEASGTAEISRPGKAAPSSPGAPPQTKRAGEA